MIIVNISNIEHNRICLELYTETEWLNCDYPFFVQSIQIKDKIFDIEQYFKDSNINNKDIGYIILSPIQMIFASGQYYNKDTKFVIKNIHKYKSIGICDDIRYAHIYGMFDVINDLEIDYLIFLVNKNQIKKYKENTNIKNAFFLPATLVKSFNRIDKQDVRYPIIGLSCELSADDKERKNVIKTLTENNIPLTFSYHYFNLNNPIDLNTTIQNSPNYFQNKNIGQYLTDCLIDNVYKIYATHIASINCPRIPFVEDINQDCGHFVYRILEIISHGSLLIQRKIPKDSGLYDVFESGKHFLEWETQEELLDVCKYALHNFDTSITMATLAQKKLNTELNQRKLRLLLHEFLINDIQLPKYSQEYIK